MASRRHPLSLTFSLTFCAIVLMLSWNSGFAAEVDADPYSMGRLYIGLAVPYSTIGGEFDGDASLATPIPPPRPPRVIMIPEVQRGFGIGACVGMRYRFVGFELGYIRTTHDVSWRGDDTEATYQKVSLDGRLYFLFDKPTQPFVALGVCFPTLQVKDGASILDDTRDSEFEGMGMNLGVGVVHFLSPKLFVSGAVTFNSIRYTEADAYSIEGDLDGSGFSLALGINYSLLNYAAAK